MQGILHIGHDIKKLRSPHWQRPGSRIILRSFICEASGLLDRASPRTLSTGIESADMPNSKSATKELRKSRSRRLRNRAQRSTLRTVVKKVRTAAEAQDKDGAEQAFRTAAKQLDQAAAKNLIHRNTAARTKSRLSKLLRTTFAASS